LLCTVSWLAAAPAFAQATGSPTPGAEAPVGTAGAGQAPPAQEGSPSPNSVQAPNAEDDVETVVVTGSRIRRDQFSAPVPITQVTQEEIEASGFTDLAQGLADLPGVTLSDTTVGQPNGTIQNAGTSTVDLRNLGSNRTLTLIDGRRTVSNAANRNVVSLNTIPVDFVERVDVITGAASAIYGSDAIAGVVNIITEQDLRGLRLRARAGQSISDEGGGAEEATLSATYGTRFADGRGYAILSASYDEDFGLLASDRLPRAGRSWSFSPSSNTVDEPDLSSDILGGYFRGGAFFYDESGLQTRFVLDEDGYNDRPLDTLRVPRVVTAFAAKVTYEVADSFKPFLQAQFSDLDTNYVRAPFGVRNTTTSLIRDPATGLPAPGFPTFTVGRIPRTNPLVPAVIAAFDDTGPEVPEGATPNDANGYIADYGVVGRTLFGGVEVRF